MFTDLHSDQVPAARRRRSLRLQGYDYTRGGAYFVTVCTSGRMNLFGNVADGEMRLNELGLAAETCWLEIPQHFPNVALDAYVIMPNHVHGILWIIAVAENNGTPPAAPVRQSKAAFHSPSKSIGSIIRGFKIGVTKWVRANSNIRQV